MTKWFFFGFVSLFLMSCDIEENNVLDTDEEAVSVPSLLSDELPFPERNPISSEGIALGRMLFYDPILSGNDNVSCATCHQQQLAFTDGISLSSNGVSGQQLLRHSPSLVNVAWSPDLFWDGGSHDLESQAFGPLEHPDEMGQDVMELVKELKESKDYSRRFQDVFNDTIHPSYIVRALAQFQRTIISAGSKYDKYLKGEEELSLVEQDGLILFKKNCAVCHATNFFTDFDYHNNGLDSVFEDVSDLKIRMGRFRITEVTKDLGAYKTPTLRNVAITSPYMHDGRFTTLKQVLEHYSHNVVFSESLDTFLVKNQLGFQFSEYEKSSIIAFLSTLTDYDLLGNVKLADPF